MTISFELPRDLDERLRDEGADLAVLAREAFVADQYRRRAFGLADVRRALGLETRLEAMRWLADRGVPINYGNEELAEDMATLDRVMGASDAGRE